LNFNVSDAALFLGRRLFEGGALCSPRAGQREEEWACKKDQVFCKTRLFITRPIRASIVKKEPMTATQILTNKLALKCCGVFSAYSEQKQCVNGCVLTPKKQATQSVIAKFASAHFQLKLEQAN
jgi:hypothetical protein